MRNDFNSVLLLLLSLCSLGCYPTRKAEKVSDRPIPKFRLPNEYSRLWELSQDTNSPIRFDTNVNEFQLVYSYKSRDKTIVERVPILYCPWTGEKLPQSNRPRATSLTDTTKGGELLSAAAAIESIDDAIKIFGSPDYKYGPFKNDLEEANGLPPIYRIGPPNIYRKQITYTNLLPNTRLTFAEDFEGNMHLFTFPE